MRFLRFVPWFFTGVLMILHGIAHGPGVLGSWNLATFEGTTRQPDFLLTSASEVMLTILGAIWLVAAIAFVIAGIGVLRQAIWWPMATALALVFSVPVTLLWRDDAVLGLMLNGVLLAFMAVWFLLGAREEQQFA